MRFRPSLLTTASLTLTCLAAFSPSRVQADESLTKPLSTEPVVFAEKDGVLAFEAEHFAGQRETAERAWYRTTEAAEPQVKPDGDPSHIAGASGGAYVEVLPDTRRSHDDRLIRGENFSNEAGKMAILTYHIHFDETGWYRIWGRAFSTNTEDNGFHVGLNGEWPASGQRWQTVTKRRWHWESRQRTAEVHVGVPDKLWLDIDHPGDHLIEIAMREDGIELDKFVFAKDFDFTPEGLGPEPQIHRGSPPEAYSVVQPVATPDDPDQETASRFPEHWGAPPDIQTRDLVPLPGGYGRGSSTLKGWIEDNLKRDQNGRDREPALHGARSPDGDGRVEITGERRQWHKITLTMDGPYAHERDRDPNPFTDYAFTVTFVHESGSPRHEVPGYFAADGDAANSSASSGTQWRAHLSPDKAGRWTYETRFAKGSNVPLDAEADRTELAAFGKQGSFEVAPTDKTGRDFRAHGRLAYVGKHHLQFQGSGRYFLKAGADAPETFLAYEDFDDTEARNPGKAPLKSWKAHLRDWQDGDPTWKDGKGKGMIGALNYLASKGCNVFSFLPYNAGGDGDNVWPFAAYGEKLHYDCSKLDQWGIVFDHATTRGLYLHFKLQETENDDDRRGHRDPEDRSIPAALDGGDLGPERKLYLRELAARYGHLLALNWNLGEENTQSTEQQRAMIDYLREVDPYDHNMVVHTFPDQQDKVYNALIGDRSQLTGISLQNSNMKDCHWQVVKWRKASAEAGKPWVVAFDEPGTAQFGMPPDPGYPGTPANFDNPSVDQTRKQALWGTLMAGGAGVEYYFGYRLPQNDLVCEDWRSRDLSWDYCRHALEFFQNHEIPFWEMRNEDALIGNDEHDNRGYCYAKRNSCYLVYLPDGGTTTLDLHDDEKTFQVRWYDPRTGGDLAEGTVSEVSGGEKVSLGKPPTDDGENWLAVLR